MREENYRGRKEFWDKQHIVNNIKSLSECSYDHTIKSLFIESLIKPSVKVLEVGVGTGDTIKGLYDNKCSVSAVDISSHPLNNIRQYCEDVYTIDELGCIPSGYFDLIIALNVIQHIPTELLDYEIAHILRSLKPSGIFAMQFVSCGNIDDCGATTPSNKHELGSYGRTPEYMQRLFKSHNAVFEIVFAEKCSIYEVTGTYVLHVKNDSKT